MTGDAPSRLSEASNVWLATVRPDGRPHLTPIWFVHLDDRFWVCADSEAVKVRNVRSNAAVALCLEDGNDPIVVEGTARVHARPYPAPVVEAFMSKFGWDLTRTDEPESDYGALVEVVVDRWLMGAPDAPG